MEKRANRKRWGPSYNFPFERDMLFASIIIRRLIESKQLPLRLLNKTIESTFHPLRNPNELRGKMFHFAQEYQMMKGTKKQISVRNFMNQIIHSYHFSPFVAPEWGVFGIFVSSDRARRDGLYYITMPKVAALIADYAKNG